ncbi:DsrE family protein [Candidatus Bathyarchaeota archaeon]|nr:DsrE family protein [Candidatus Bathyarchaeota archaeon]
MNFLFAVSKTKSVMHLMGIVRASTDKGHDVKIFFNEDSVKLLVRYPVLSELGVEMLACHTTCRDMNIEEGDLISNARMTSMAELVMLMESMDRTLFLG